MKAVEQILEFKLSKAYYTYSLFTFGKEYDYFEEYLESDMVYCLCIIDYHRFLFYTRYDCKTATN